MSGARVCGGGIPDAPIPSRAVRSSRSCVVGSAFARFEVAAGEGPAAPAAVRGSRSPLAQRQWRARRDSPPLLGAVPVWVGRARGMQPVPMSCRAD